MFINRTLLLLLCLAASAISYAQNITAAEYFFDEDPGAGKGKSLLVGTASDSVHFVASISTTSLQEGFHTLCIRTRTLNRKWGIFESRSFYISKSGGGLPNITAAEYFFDEDPGAGKGKSLPVGTAGDSVHFVASISTTSLQEGFHTLCIRTRTLNRKWGIFESRSFYISKSGGGLPNITAAEYFFDEDPGAGKGKSLPVGTAGDSVHFVASISTTSLQEGFHTLCIRTRTLNRKWGIFESRSFYISQTGGALPNITAAEYFFDKDPGSGKGAKLNIGTPDDSVHFVASIPTKLLSGRDHILIIRVKNKQGQWSIYEKTAFTYSISDNDRDGLIDWDEPRYGTDYTIFDTNDDGLADGVNVFTGLKPTAKDTDGDGLSNILEGRNGTSPVLWDTDGDGVSDKLDAFPLDRFRTKLPPPNSADHTAPVINLKEPF